MAAVLLLAMSVHAFACEPVHLKFEGTPFARRSVQIENDRIFFFRGMAHEIMFSYNASKRFWCYEAKSERQGRPAHACLARKAVGSEKSVLTVNGKAVKHFILRDHKDRPVVTIMVSGKSLTASFLDRDGKALGKRMDFTSVTRDHLEVLEVRGWNCPNEKFLSCAGAELTSVHESEDAPGPRLQVADLAKKLGHFRFSCNGMTEQPLDGETKRAPSMTEP